MLSYFSSLFFKKQRCYFNNIINLNHTSCTPEYAYCNNVIVYKCVNMISLTASQVRFKSDSKNSLVQNLLQSPNILEDWSSWLKNVVANRVLFGNAFILFENDQLININPNCISAIVRNKVLKGYNYNNKEYLFHEDNICSIMKIQNFNPLSNSTGMSPVKAAYDAINLYNKVVHWNISLVQNGARPSGAFVVDRPLTPEEFDDLEKRIQEKFSGEMNAGSPMILNGIDWKEMSINHSDMEFQESKRTSARDIALAFGISPVLLGIQGDSTYSNLKEARIALWEETVIPILKNLSFTLSKNLSRILQENINIECDYKNISVLFERESEKWNRVESASFLTDAEKRNILNI